MNEDCKHYGSFYCMLKCKYLGITDHCKDCKDYDKGVKKEEKVKK